MKIAAAKDIMTTGVVSVSSETPLFDAAKVLRDHDFSGVPVVDEKGVLVGILTDYDLVTKGSALHLPTLQKLLHTLPLHGEEDTQELKKIKSLVVRDVMNTDPLTLAPDTALQEVVETFRAHHRVNPIPIVDTARRVVGIIARYDLIKIFDKALLRSSAEGWAEDAFELLQKDYVFASNIAEEKMASAMQYIQTFADAVKSSADAILITDVDAKIVYVNPAWERLNGYILQEVYGKNPSVLKSGKTSSDVYRGMWEALQRGESFVSDEVVNRRKDGTEYREEISISPMRRDGVILFYVAVIRDITKRKEVDRAKNEFISLTAHQLSTPLTVIGWNTDALLRERMGALTEEQKGYLAQIYESSKGMEELVDMFLNIGRLESGNFALRRESLQLADIVENVLRNYAISLKQKRIEIVKQFSQGVPLVVTDARGVRIIVQNLLSNAIKYTPAGGRVTLVLKAEEGKIYFSVADTGYGIPAAEQKQVFIKFFRSPSVTAMVPEGTGLGLYLVKMIAERIGVTIHFTSKEQEGTTFVVTFSV